MPNLAQQPGLAPSVHQMQHQHETHLIPRFPPVVLPIGAIIGITIAGVIVFFLAIVGPSLLTLARWQDRKRANTASTASSLSFAEYGGHVAQERRKLRKKTNSGGMWDLVGTGFGGNGGELGGGDKEEIEGGRGRGLSPRLSLPVLPPLSRVGSFNVGTRSPFSGSDGAPGNGNGYGNECGGSGGVNSTRSSREKHRGYVIYQNRRRTTWIDEDAIHGPTVSPKRQRSPNAIMKRKARHIIRNNSLARTLSRHLSIRKLREPKELERTPTLPCTETGPGQGLWMGSGFMQDGNVADSQMLHELPGESETAPRYPPRQDYDQNWSMSQQMHHIRIVHPQPMRIAVPSVAYRSHIALDTAGQSEGQERVPPVDVGQRYSRAQPQRNTDAELQAILRRTAERLQDGNRSARRQSLMRTTSALSCRLPNQTSQECECGKEHARSGGDSPDSPTKSQKSAPAVMLYSELEGCSPRIPQDPPGGGAPRHGHKRTHTRQISFISQVSDTSMFSEPDVRRGSQSDGMNTALSSPSRVAQPKPIQMNTLSYSPASVQSSALSTLWSEEEGNPPVRELNVDGFHKRGSEMEKRAMAEALRACDALGIGVNWKDGSIRDGERGTGFQTERSHRPLHVRKGTMGQILPEILHTGSVSASTLADSIKRSEARSSSNSPSASARQTLQGATEDPFTARTPPGGRTPQRLSQVFSPLPAELPGHEAGPSVYITETSSGTPTPSPSHRRVIPPPHRLQPARSSPTLGLGNRHNSQLQIQPPSREPSPVGSEGRLSSVYESYRYSRYSNETSPTKSKWEDNITPAVSSGAIGYTVEVALPRSQPHRENSIRIVSDATAPSTYSQDEGGGDQLAPLMPVASTAPSHQNALHITNTVAELRRMNSMASCVSGHSTVVGNTVCDVETTSPTLPELRGGGFSPGKKGAKGGVSNYLALGGSPSSRRSRGDKEGNKESQNGKWTAAVGIREGQTAKGVNRNKSVKEQMAQRRGGVARSRRNSVVDSFEQDLRRARQVLRENRGHNLQAIPEAPKKTDGLITRAVKLMQEEG